MWLVCLYERALKTQSSCEFPVHLTLKSEAQHPQLEPVCQSNGTGLRE